MKERTRICVIAKGTPLARRIRVARAFRERLIGLLGCHSIDPDEGMMFYPGGSIHTMGMRCHIDVAFLDADNRVLKICSQVKPMRMRIAPSGTCSTLELAPGVLSKAAICIGEVLECMPQQAAP